VAGFGVLKLKVQAAANEGSSEDSSLASVTGIFKIVKCLRKFNIFFFTKFYLRKYAHSFANYENFYFLRAC
jgi:hypothetical protein